MRFSWNSIWPRKRKKASLVFRKGFYCDGCGKFHQEIPDIGFSCPTYWHELSDSERAEGVLTSEECHVHGYIFVRCVLSIPIKDYPDYFGFGVWSTLSQESYERMKRFDAGEDIGADLGAFGWLSTDLTEYGFADSLNHASDLSFGKPGQRPIVTLHDSESLLSKAQREGIDLPEALCWVRPFLHA